MEPTLNTPTTQASHDTQSPSLSAPQPEAVQYPIHKKNIYPYARHSLIILSILFAFFLILFLIHQNGKSIYDNGI